MADILDAADALGAAGGAAVSPDVGIKSADRAGVPDACGPWDQAGACMPRVKMTSRKKLKTRLRIVLDCRIVTSDSSPHNSDANRKPFVLHV